MTKHSSEWGPSTLAAETTHDKNTTPHCNAPIQKDGDAASDDAANHDKPGKRDKHDIMRSSTRTSIREFVISLIIMPSVPIMNKSK